MAFLYSGKINLDKLDFVTQSHATLYELPVGSIEILKHLRRQMSGQELRGKNVLVCELVQKHSISNTSD